MKRYLFILSALIGGFGIVRGQTGSSHNILISVPRVALISVETTNNDGIVFQMREPNEAGHRINIANRQMSGLWLNYSSTLQKSQGTHKVYATITGSLPEGFTLALEAGTYTGDGKGKMGQPSGKKFLSQTPVEVISQIGNCYTGKGINNGHQLTYFLDFDEDNYELISSGEFNHIQVTYTITE